MLSKPNVMDNVKHLVMNTFRRRCNYESVAGNRKAVHSDIPVFLGVDVLDDNRLFHHATLFRHGASRSQSPAMMQP